MRVNYQSFRNDLLPLKSFSLNDARKHFPGFDRKRLTQWQQKGYLRQIIQGHYLFSEVKESEELWWFIANRVVQPSYISLQTALAYYDFIPEATFQIMSITTRKTRNFEVDEKLLSYQNIKPAAFFGYHLVEWQDTHISMAEPEKAILDLLYLNPHLNSGEDFGSMRFYRDEILETCDLQKFNKYAAGLHNKALISRANQFQSWLNA